MSQLLLVEANPLKLNRSAVSRIKQGEYKIHTTHKLSTLHLVLENGDRIEISHELPISIPQTQSVYVEITEPQLEVITLLLR